MPDHHMAIEHIIRPSLALGIKKQKQQIESNYFLLL